MNPDLILIGFMRQEAVQYLSQLLFNHKLLSLPVGRSEVAEKDVVV